MEGWFTLPTLIAFILGVLLSAMVKSTVMQVKGKVTG